MADEDENKNNMSGADDELELEAADPEVLTEKLAAAEKQRDEYLSGWQRAKADFANYKKEDMKRLEEMAQYGSKDIIKELISVLDNFDLGLKVMEKNGPVEKGIYLIRSQIEDILKKRGLEKINVKLGDEFDPNIAEAMAEISSDHPIGTVVEEIEPGYKLHDKILKAARVVISKGNIGAAIVFLSLVSPSLAVPWHYHDHLSDSNVVVRTYTQTLIMNTGTTPFMSGGEVIQNIIKIN